MFTEKEVLKKKLSSKKKEDKQEESSGRVVLVLLIVSTGLTLAFYLSSFLPAFWQKITAPKVIRLNSGQKEVSPVVFESAPTPTPWQKNLEEELVGLISQQDGLYGIYLYEINSQRFLGVNHQESFSAASLMKLPVVIAAYQEAERKQFDLTAQYHLREEDKLSGNGSVHLQPEGTVYTYRALIKLAIEQSDNTAISVIAKAIEEEKIQKNIDRLGLTKTDYVLRKTTPEDIGQLLLALHQGKALTSAHSQEIIGFLTNSIFNDQIPAFLPDNLVIAHKIGLDENLLHDAAIIFVDDGDFILVIMSQGDPEDRAQTVLEEITKMVWEAVRNSN
ncbi:MAG: class A beta-lactamase-related serine hydrolase [Candidatus Shapirobacteria bacterium]|nr:class A beta-lactamase-related serine hydrolase [Candidatus Shapirobacteria bacterium]MDD5073862.1 class A beta-lactamase-related serine hydrolase [Candidatus Shapirobacteria bacterium]MDD5481739.1 class A beta-lactamase-related serine hydrolase [Candidatus Shapirobacteria bacterium]